MIWRKSRRGDISIRSRRVVILSGEASLKCQIKFCKNMTRPAIFGYRLKSVAQDNVQDNIDWPFVVICFPLVESSPFDYCPSACDNSPTAAGVREKTLLVFSRHELPKSFLASAIFGSGCRITDNTSCVPSVSTVSYPTSKVTRPLAQRLTHSLRGSRSSLSVS